MADSSPSRLELSRAEVEEAIDSGDPWNCRNLLAKALLTRSEIPSTNAAPQADPVIGIASREKPADSPAVAAPSDKNDLAAENAAANAEAIKTAEEIVAGDRVGIHVREVRLARALLRFEKMNALYRELLKSKGLAPSAEQRSEIIESVAKMVESVPLTYAGPDPQGARDLRYLIVCAIRDMTGKP